MAETYAKRKQSVLRQVGAVKRSLNQANGRLEVVRREMKRLGERKTIITPDDLVKVGKQWQDASANYNQVAFELTKLFTIARSYL